ncbi:hypothetical protein KC318_g12668 [Hortaea werneckii]|nr:hypothetical protein KC334_g6744 [Hortaea werneckii]KAI6983656.1 hypothetical protein KC355_g10841 [Hortaea werneckii]KAI7656046.1 hypothetical protein KC318_g12668 [Hortaea werneckii]
MNAVPLGEEGSEGLGELDGLFNLYIDSTRIGDVQSANFVMDEIAAGLQGTSDPYKAEIAAVTSNYHWHLDASGLNALVDILAEYVATRMSRESFMSNFQDPAFADAQPFFFKVTCFALNQSGDRSNLHSFMGKEKREWHVEEARESGSKMIEIE